MSVTEELADEAAIEAMTDRDYRLHQWRALREVLVQVKTTNGRVTKLEQWRLMAIGALSVVTVLVVPLFIKVVVE